jgi:hypothetical protein
MPLLDVTRMVRVCTVTKIRRFSESVDHTAARQDEIAAVT